MLSEKKIHKAGRIDQVVRDYFNNSKSLNEVAALSLMPLFIEKGIFLKDSQRKGLPIRNFLRELAKEDKLSLLKNAKVVRKDRNRNWYFVAV